jgi:glyoxylase-like metal-dependent hydrolase (beta-lactamase superfamily II)
MKLIEITPEIIQLTRFGLVNCFPVREDDGLTLVDTMVAGSANGIYAAASSLTRSLRRILLTHVHATISARWMCCRTTDWGDFENAVFAAHV